MIKAQMEFFQWVMTFDAASEMLYVLFTFFKRLNNFENTSLNKNKLDMAVSF